MLNWKALVHPSQALQQLPSLPLVEYVCIDILGPNVLTLHIQDNPRVQAYFYRSLDRNGEGKTRQNIQSTQILFILASNKI